MPKQHTLFGRQLPRMGNRRISFIFICLSLFAIISLLFTLPNAITENAALSHYADHLPAVPKLSNLPNMPNFPKLPKFKTSFTNSILNPFKQPSHPPPRQKNDTYHESSWWADWKWLSVPFSSSLTLDEDRSILPPLRERPPIYCYYDATLKKDKGSKDAESDLLLTWRRAWWAQGFKPLILSAAEAMNNPVYDELQRMEMEAGLKNELMRWLAWENMGGGLLSNFTVLPMGPHEDAELTFLRRGEYPRLTRWEGMDTGLFVGAKADVASAIKEAMAAASDPNAGKAGDKDSKDFLEVLPKQAFQVYSKPKSIAYYDIVAIEGKYSKVAKIMQENRAKGLKSLNQLINSHLQSTWQHVFSDGIAVLKPLPHHSTHMVTDAWQLATDLSQCSDSPMTASCPPNNARCNPCVSSKPMHIGTPGRYKNSSTLYTIGTVPHPYTTAILSELRDDIDIAWVRRHSPRDPWLSAATIELLGAAVGSSVRILRFKEAVAGDYATAHSLWLTAEKSITEEGLQDELEWHFGFDIPHGKDRGKSKSPVPGPERLPKQEHDLADGPVATEKELEKEPRLLEIARKVGHDDSNQELVAVRGALEAWNIADTEAWKFTRAFLAQRIVERKEWEKEESRYVGGAGTEKGRQKSWGDRWSDDEDEEGSAAKEKAKGDDEGEKKKKKKPEP